MLFQQHRRRLLSAGSGGPNYTMLYYYGDECEDVTGGWTGGYTHSAYTTGGYSKESTYLRTYELNSNGYGNTGFVTNKPISNAEYPKLQMFYTLPTVTCTTSSNCAVNIYALLEPVVSAEWYYADENKQYRSAVTSMQTHIAKTHDGGDTTATDIYVVFVSNSGAQKGYKIDMRTYAVAALKEDNWKGLCAKVGLDATAYADEAALCADSAAISAILSTESAVKYMVQNCTGTFMGEFIASGACLSALSGSQHEALIRTNEHWAKFLAMVE